MENFKIVCVAVGVLRTNCYLVKNTATNHCFLVDPGAQGEKIARFLIAEGLTPDAILLTHGHFDHIGAVKTLKETFRIPVICSEAEEETLSDPDINLSGMISGKEISLLPDRTLRDGEEMNLCGFSIRCILTPGHTAGGMCFYLPEEKTLFCGDTLFAGSYGRIDFPTGSSRDLKHSLKEVLFALPEDTVCYPGHGEPTAIGEEKKSNPIMYG